jgi:hypothetical protein
MNAKARSFAFVLVNAAIIGTCIVRAALAHPECDPVGHGTACPTAPSGCTDTAYHDNPTNCCYMAGPSWCCTYYRQKHVYTGTCPGLPSNCSECVGAANPEPGSVCNTTNGFCESAG